MSDEVATIPELMSVVIPIGKVDGWLDEAVDSVLSQEGVELELIAVFNNGANVPDDWKFLTDHRVKIIHDTRSLGSGGAGQRGIDSAKGEYFVRLDSDDRMRPGRLRQQYDYMKSHLDTVLVSSQVDWINERGEKVGSFDLPSGADVRDQILSLNICPHPSWAARMETVRQAGGYDPEMDQMDDYDLLLRIAAAGKVAILPDTLTDYRLHSGQMSRAVKPNGHYVKVIAERRRYLGAAIGVAAWRVALARCWWETQQWMMYFGRKVRGLWR